MKTYRKGAVGALMDEYERAVDELIPILGGMSDVDYEVIRDSETDDENCRSIQTILTHVVGAGYGYAGMMREAWGMERIGRVREEMALGTKVTLRGDRMYEFLDRLINVALPRVRDFRGVKGTSFDGRGNYAMGLKEHIVFPEINFDKVDEVLGMDIIICTTAPTDAEAKALLKHFNMPFNS